MWHNNAQRLNSGMINTDILVWQGKTLPVQRISDDSTFSAVRLYRLRHFVPLKRQFCATYLRTVGEKLKNSEYLVRCHTP